MGSKGELNWAEFTRGSDLEVPTVRCEQHMYMHNEVQHLRLTSCVEFAAKCLHAPQNLFGITHLSSVCCQNITGVTCKRECVALAPQNQKQAHDIHNITINVLLLLIHCTL